MATVHTAYGPGEIIDQETVRGRTQYKVAGDGFEVWLDETKIAGYTPPGEVDFSAPHWEGHEPTESLTPDAFGGGYEPVDEHDLDEYADPRGYFKRDRMRTPADYDGYGEGELEHLSSRRQAWAPMDHDNSTTLPYNPEPQHNAVGQVGDDDGSATIQPIHHIDADERLRPSDSLTFDDEEYDTPAPNDDLFAKSAAHDLVVNHPLFRKTVEKILPDKYKKNLDTLIGFGSAATVNKGVNYLDNAAGQVIDKVGPGRGWGDLIKPASVHEATPAALLPAVLRAVGPSLASGLMGGGEGPDVDDMGPGDGWGELVKDGSYRPAGLDDRYIDLTASADYHNDPVAQFRHDPDAYINRIGNIFDEGLNPRFAEYMDLVEADNGIRTAAWKDVRKKAMRLKREGHVTVKDLAPNRIMASVVGDNGTYDVLILKAGSFGGLNEGNPGHSIANWHCGCEWGRWAFRRKFSYVGRLCSHAYASYLTMQSAAVKGKPRQQKRVKEKAPARALPFLHVKRGSEHTADALQNGPMRLTPELVVNDADDAHMFMDVTKDERDDVGPDDVVSEKDIVHFARMMRHCEVTEQPYPRQLVAFLARYAGCADDSADDTQNDYKAHDATDANQYLEEIRSDADRKQENDFGNMAERVHKIQDAVEEARAHGVDADRFVASVQKMALPGYGTDLESDYTPAKSIFDRSNIVEPGGQYKGYGPMTNVTPSTNKGTGGPPASGDPLIGNGVNPGKKDENSLIGPAGGVAPTSAPSGGSDRDAFKDLSGVGPKAPANNGKAGQPANNGQSPAASQPGQGGGGGGGGAAASPTSGNVADGGKAGAESGNNEAIKGNEYTVQAGDTLTDIAQRAYGDMNRYQDIAKANGIENVDQLEVGKTFKLDNAQGNNGVSGDKTNPAGGGADKDIATPDVAPPVAPAVNTNAADASQGINPPVDAAAPAPAPAASLVGGGADAAAGVQPAQKPAVVGSLRSAKDWMKWAAGEAQNPANPTNQTQGQDGTTNTTAPTTPAAPGTGLANPAAPGVAAPATGAQPGGTNSPTPATVGPTKDGDTYDPDNPAEVEDQQGTGAERNGGGQAENPSMSGGMDGGMGGMDALSGIGDIASGIGGALPDLASGAMQAAPAIASGIGDMASGLMSGLGGILGSASPSSSIFSSRQDFDDWARYAYPAGGGDDFDPETLPHIPFAGSGNPGPLEIGTSEEYADKARAKADDVTDLGSGDLTKPMGDWQKQGAIDPRDVHELMRLQERGLLEPDTDHDWSEDESAAIKRHYRSGEDVDRIADLFPAEAQEVDEEGDTYRQASYDGYSTDDSSDIVRAFQANLDNTALGAGAGGGGGGFDDIAGAAAGFLRTAGRNYSMAEQSELIREGDKGGARNLDSLDLSGTHYEDMHTLGW